VLVRTVHASAPGALARNDDVGNAVVGQVCAHLTCACAHVGEYDHARAAAITPCERIVPPDGFECRKHLGIAVFFFFFFFLDEFLFRSSKLVQSRS
jgi:hypothetical protein